MSGVRCFVGLPLPPDVAGPLVAACEAIRSNAPGWRGEKWVAENNLHVTIAFIGNVAENDVERLTDGVGAAVGASRAFELAFRGIRAVPNRHRCRMLWAEFTDPDGYCAALADAVLAASAPFGAEIPDRAFRAHVTLVRSRKPRPLPENALEAAETAASDVAGSMSVLSATLFASTLTPRGPVYSELGKWPLSQP